MSTASRATARSTGRAARRDAFEEIFEIAPDGLLLVDPRSGAIARANRAAGVLLGSPPAALAGGSLAALLCEATLTARNLVESAPLAAAELSTRDVRRADGTLARLRVGAGFTAWGRGKMVLLALRPPGGEEQLVAQRLAAAGETATQHRAQRAEAEYSTALAQVSRELISSLTTPDVYRRLCAAVAEVLGCEVSTVFLWNGREQAYAAVASHGDSAERWEELRLVRLGVAMVERLLHKLGAQSVVRITDLPFDDPVRRGLGGGYDLSDALVVALRRGDELIGFLCAGYRQPAADLSPHQERIARGIGHVASLAIQNARLVEELERANRIKSDFVATMSHELRTPLNVVIGYHDLLLEGEFGPLTAQQADRLRRAERSARDLLDLINATLDLGRLDAGQVPLVVEHVNLRTIVAAVANELAALRGREGVRFEWRFPAELPPIETDPVKLRVVLKHLIHNAFKFTESGAVSLRVRTTAQRVEFEVRDTGVGIAPDMLDAIFEPFRQADSSSTRSYGGAGLGLFIVRRLLELLGGEILVESELGRGSRFRFWIPLRLP